MKSKDKRLQEIRENRRNFSSFRRSIKENFQTKSPRFERDASLLEAEFNEESALDLEHKKYQTSLASENHELLDFLDTPTRESYSQAAISYYQAGIYSVYISDPLTAFRCFKRSARNYRALAELSKPELIYGLMIQEANVAEDKARIVRHEAAFRRARLLGLSLGCLGRK